MKKILKMMLSFLLFLGFIFSSIITPNVYVFADIDNDDLEFQAREIGLTEAKFECMEEAVLNFDIDSSTHKAHDNFHVLHYIDGLEYYEISGS